MQFIHWLVGTHVSLSFLYCLATRTYFVIWVLRTCCEIFLINLIRIYKKVNLIRGGVESLDSLSLTFCFLQVIHSSRKWIGTVITCHKRVFLFVYSFLPLTSIWAVSRNCRDQTHLTLTTGHFYLFGLSSLHPHPATVVKTFNFVLRTNKRLPYSHFTI